MSGMITVGISDMKVTRSPNVLVTYALGSCVGICLYDPVLKIAGLGHIMLPTCPPNGRTEDNKFKFADTCFPLMLQEMGRMGCVKARLIAKIAGGAKMFEVIGDNAFGNIGERNVVAVRAVLREAGVRLAADDVGLNYGRTVFLSAENGEVRIKSFAKGERFL